MSSSYNLPSALDIPDDEPFTKSILDQAFDYINKQLVILNSFKPDYEEQISELQQIGLDRINSALAPVFADLQSLAGLGTIFVASSETSLPVVTGTATFVIGSAQRQRFAPAGYMQAVSGDLSSVMSGLVTSYDNTTGSLVIQVTVCYGSGTFSSWSLTPSIPPILGAPIVDGGVFDAANSAGTRIAHKRSLTSGHAPSALSPAEIAINVIDGILYWGDNANSVHAMKMTSTDVDSALAAKANLNGPSFTGSPRTPTANTGDASTIIANTSFVTAAVQTLQLALTDSVQDSLNTLRKISVALGGDANFATTVTTALGNRLRVDASQSLTTTQQSTARTNLGLGKSQALMITGSASELSQVTPATILNMSFTATGTACMFTASSDFQDNSNHSVDIRMRLLLVDVTSSSSTVSTGGSTGITVNSPAVSFNGSLNCSLAYNSLVVGHVYSIALQAWKGSLADGNIIAPDIAISGVVLA